VTTVTPSAWIENPGHRSWLATETLRLLDFGRACVPTARGAAWLDDDGVADLAQPTFTWVTARMAHVYALGYLLGVPGCRPIAERALAALRTSLHDDVDGGWFASLAADGTPDTTKSAYAHAFVVLAASTGTVAGLEGARALLDDALAVLDARFWEPAAGMHADEWDGTWTTLDPYRGVNANMHAVEALLAAGDATGDPRWHERAAAIADRVCGWAGATGWRVPEHFDARWGALPELNADRPGDQFKPYGATVGHGLEWARLLLQVDAALPGRAATGLTRDSAAPDAPTPGRTSLVDGARELYDRAVRDSSTRRTGPERRSCATGCTGSSPRRSAPRPRCTRRPAMRATRRTTPAGGTTPASSSSTGAGDRGTTSSTPRTPRVARPGPASRTCTTRSRPRSCLSSR